MKFPSQMEKAHLSMNIDGMQCDGCVRRVTAALSKVEGVDLKEVRVGCATLQFDPSITEKRAVLDAVNRIGFNAVES